MTRFAKRLVRLRQLASGRAVNTVTFVILLPLMATIFVFSLFYVARDVKFVGNIAGQATGNWMAIFADSWAPRPGARPIVLLDFDDASGARFGDPVLVPPQITGAVLERLAAMNPWAVFVDLDLASLAGSDADAVREGLAALDATGVAVLLGRDTLPMPGAARSARLRASELDRDVARTGSVIWTSIAYDLASDGVVRTFPEVQTIASPDGDVTLASVPLALRLLAMEGDARGMKRVLAAGLAGTQDCARARRDELLFCTRSGALSVPRNGASLIRYSFRWPPVGSNRRVPTPSGSGPQLVRVPMYPLVAVGSASSPALFRDALVVVTATAARRDLRATPLDVMPGAFILANAARGWLEFGPERDNYLAGLAIALAGTLVLTGFAWLVLTLAPARWRHHVHAHLAAGLIGMLWLLFLMLGSPAVSVGLVVTSYLVVTIVILCHRRARPLPPAAARGRDNCDTPSPS
jgi:hypothetical protein